MSNAQESMNPNEELFTKWLRSTLTNDERKVVSEALRNDPNGTLATMIDEYKKRASNAMNVDGIALAESIYNDAADSSDKTPPKPRS